MAKCIAAEGSLFEKNGVILCLVSPISNEYPETFGASLRTSFRWKQGLRAWNHFATSIAGCISRNISETLAHSRFLAYPA